MKKENVVIKKECHCRGMLSAISRIRLHKQTECNSLKTTKQKEDSQQEPLGMTPLYNNGAFTLIELLVVVLIIGILAAVAVPQYQRAVDKTRVSQLFPVVKNVKTQQELFYLENGKYADGCEELAGDFPSGSQIIQDETITDGSQKLVQWLANGYIFTIKCNNGGTTTVAGTIASEDSSFKVNIEMYLSNLPNWAVQNTGKSFCYSHNKTSRELNLCKSFGGTVKTNNSSYWITF